jgi:hypothetical protein
MDIMIMTGVRGFDQARSHTDSDEEQRSGDDPGGFCNTATNACQPLDYQLRLLTHGAYLWLRSVTAVCTVLSRLVSPRAHTRAKVRRGKIAGDDNNNSNSDKDKVVIVTVTVTKIVIATAIIRTVAMVITIVIAIRMTTVIKIKIVITITITIAIAIVIMLTRATSLNAKRGSERL